MNFEKFNDVVLNTKDLELMSILLTGDGSHAQKKICVTLTYRTPVGDSMVAVNHLRNTVQQLCDNCKYETILLGDLNWDCLVNNEHIDEL